MYRNTQRYSYFLELYVLLRIDLSIHISNVVKRQLFAFVKCPFNASTYKVGRLD